MVGSEVVGGGRAGPGCWLALVGGRAVPGAWLALVSPRTSVSVKWISAAVTVVTHTFTQKSWAQRCLGHTGPSQVDSCFLPGFTSVLKGGVVSCDPCEANSESPLHLQTDI